jgi:hypothetical protein
MSGEELCQEIAEVVGENIADMIVAIQVYREGDIKIWPKSHARATLEDITWVKKWIPSAVAPKKEYDLLITRIPVKGTADEMVEELEREYRKQNLVHPLQISRAKWKERNVEELKIASLRITVPTVEMADRLIINGIGIKRKHYRVRKFIKNFHPGKENTPLYGKVGEGATPPSSEDDRLFTDEEVVFSSSSETSQDGKRKLLAPHPPSKRPTRGRPPGALNKPKFGQKPIQGENPFAIASTQPEKGGYAEADVIPDSQMTQ